MTRAVATFGWLVCACAGTGVFGAGRPAQQPAAAPTALDQEPDVVLHAGGRVQLSLPAGWSVAEVPHAREIRLLAAPANLEAADAIPAEGGFWVCAHGAIEGLAEHAQLKDLLAARLEQAVGPDTTLTGPTESLELRQVAGVIQPFHVLTRHGARQGFHGLFPCGWGHVEVHCNVPLGNREALERTRELVRQMRIADPPARPVAPLADHVEPARSILGTWKAFRSRLRLDASGRIEVLLDRPRTVGGPARQPPPAGMQNIVGQFEARDDLLFVRWNDGSLLNFRWRLDGQELLMTDHDGRISQLRRVLD